MKSISGKDFCRRLEKRGWVRKRVSGSHHVYATADNPARISVPVHGNRSLKVGLLKHLMKAAGMTDADL